MAIGAGLHFPFNPPVGFPIKPRIEDAADAIWDRLSAGPEAEQAGRLKDKFGVSWQVMPGGH